MARDLQTINVINGSSLTVNGRTVFSKEFPLGEGWHKVKFRFGIVLTVGTGTGAIAEGELKIIKNVLLRTDKGETICNIPGRALYKIATYKSGSPPRKDAIAAASATYYVDLPIFLADPMMAVPTDTLLDTGRYNSVSLDLTMGGVADLLSTVGTSSVTLTLDAEIERTQGLIPDEAKPLFHIAYETVPPVDASSQTYIDIDKSTDLAIKRLYVHECSSGSSGVPWSGTNADDVKSVESVQDQSGFIVQERIHEMIQNDNKDDAGLESVLAGVTITDFVKDGSVNSALWTGDKSRLQYKWTNKAGVASGDLVTATYEALRTLKAV